MTEATWNEARLIPTSGINGADEQERRATSALLAVMTAVREFGRALTQPFGAGTGRVETFIEVPFQLRDKRIYPDGLIRVSRGQRTWTALVEVKTGTNELAPDQLENYLDVAKEHGFQALLTISNEIPAVPGQHPTKVDKRKLKTVALHHLSWTQVLTEAVVQKEHRGVADSDQAWILAELIRYLEHPRSGALEFEDMGPSWVSVREAVSAGILRSSDKGLHEVAARFDALLRFAGLRLGRQLGTDVIPVLSRADLADPASRAQFLVETLCATGRLEGAIRIPDAVGHLVVTADLRAGQVTCHVDLDAPREGRPLTRINWLVRQLRGSTAQGVRIETFAAYQRGPGPVELLDKVRQDPAALIADPTKDIRAFRISVAGPAGMKRANGRGSFIDSVLAVIDLFYEDVVQRLKAWSATPPRLRDHPEPGPTRSALDSTALSSQDGPETPPSLPPVLEPARELPATARHCRSTGLGIPAAGT